MAAVLRVKRHVDEEPLNALVLNRKKRKIESGFVNGNSSQDEYEITNSSHSGADNISSNILTFTGTIKNKSDIANHIKKISKETANESVKKIHQTNLKERSRQQCREYAQEQRFKIVNCYRTIDDENDENAKNITVVDIEKQRSTSDAEQNAQVTATNANVQQQQLDSTILQSPTTPTTISTTTTATTTIPAEAAAVTDRQTNASSPPPSESTAASSTSSSSSSSDQYVFDIYYMENGPSHIQDPDNNLLDDLLSVQEPHTSDYPDNQPYEEDDENDSEDSNDENNWRNDYPDEDSMNMQEMKYAIPILNNADLFLSYDDDDEYDDIDLYGDCSYITTHGNFFGSHLSSDSDGSICEYSN